MSEREKHDVSHAVKFSGHVGSFFHPFVAYCETCVWVCGGAPHAVRKAARKHAGLSENAGKAGQ